MALFLVHWKYKGSHFIWKHILESNKSFEFSFSLNCLQFYISYCSCDWKWKSLNCVWLCNPLDYTIHGILQARILEWVVIPFSRESSWPRDWTQVSCVASGFFTSWATRELLSCFLQILIYKFWFVTWGTWLESLFGIIKNK